MWTISETYEQARRASEKDADMIRRTAEHTLDTYLAHMPGITREEIGRRLLESNRERLDAVPDLNTYPELRGMREILDAEWRGIRDGAKLDDEQWAARCNGNFYMHCHVYGEVGKEDHGCTCIYFPESEHGSILAVNLDTNLEEPYGPPEWPTWNEHIIVGGVSSGIWGDEPSPEIFPAPKDKILGRYARSTDEAIEILDRYKLFGRPGNLLIVDRNHNIAMVEMSACRIGVRRSNDGFGFITAMTAEEPTFRAYLDKTRDASLKARDLPEDCDDTTYWKKCDQRRELLNEMLDEARQNPTLEKLRSMIQCRDPKRGFVCYDGDPIQPGGPPLEWTMRTAIWMLNEKKAIWWSKEGDAPSWETRMSDVEFKEVLPWD